MGSDNFFSKVASIDPLAQALNLPGAHKYAQAVAQRNAGDTDVNGGAYTGIAPTLAAANAGYKPGGPGAPAGWAPMNTGSNPNGIFGLLTKNANLSGNATPQPWATGTLKPFTQANPSAGFNNTNVQPTQTMNPYVSAARGASQNAWGQS